MSLARNRHTPPPRPDTRKLRAGWLSLFAMLMIFIGPLVSQSMPMDHSTTMSMDMGAGMDEAAAHHGDAHHGGGDASLHVMWEKCGYCSLFFHCPALPQHLSLLNSETLATGNTLSVQPRHGHPRPAFFPRRPQPRTTFQPHRLNNPDSRQPPALCRERAYLHD